MESNLQPNPAPVIESQTQSQNTYPAQPVKPKTLTGWGSLMGVFSIINGAFISLTVILAIIGIPMIIAGIKQLKAVSLSREITISDPKTNEVFDNLNSCFKINGIAIICGIALSIIGFIIFLAFGMFALIQGANNF